MNSIIPYPVSTIIVTTIAVLIVFIFFGRTLIYDELARWQIIPRPETYSELYLHNSLELPKQVHTGQNVSFSFSIANREGARTAYTYRVYAQNSFGADSPIDHGTVTLDNFGSTTITESYRIASAITQEHPETIYVDLVGTNEIIHFMLPSRE
jgi:hypothetical protein